MQVSPHATPVLRHLSLWKPQTRDSRAEGHEFEDGSRRLDDSLRSPTRHYHRLMTDVTASVAGPLSGPTGRRVAAHRAQLRDVLRRHGVRNPQLFGSVARGEEGPGSDVDILVELAPGTGLLAIARMQAELEAMLGVGVDLVPSADLKPAVRARVEHDLISL